MKNNYKIYYWACDNSKNTGEGKLGLFFLNSQINKNFLKIPNNNKFKFFNYKYIKPFYGIYNCWKYYLDKKKVCYINYLPFWNFLIFLLLPPATIIGPITGGANFGSKFNLIRNLFFPIFYKLSEIIISFRNYKIIFSTDLLKKYLNKKTIKNSEFNFVIKYFQKKNKKIKKKIDFLIYYRKHPNKKNLFPYFLIKNLLKLNFKIRVIGDKLEFKGVFNYGFLDNEKISSLQSKTKFTIVSDENIYSLFTLECIKNNVKIITNSNQISSINFFKNSFIKVNYNNIYELKKKLNFK